jgi:hypothetical protein
MGIKKKISGTLSDQKRIEFAKQIESLYEAQYAHGKKILAFAFLKGVATGLGVFLGGTILVGALLWILSQLNQLPFVGDISESAKHSISEKKSN